MAIFGTHTGQQEEQISRNGDETFMGVSKLDVRDSVPDWEL